MAEEASESSGSADSYIGSLISLTSKSEIRYEGILFNINASESSIGLRDVRSFGSEGRKKDGPQVPPSDKVFEYILFRGSDVKDLQVKASPPVQTPAPIYHDPAIIQSHYPQTTTSTSFPSAGTGSLQDLSPHISQLPLYRPGGGSGSWAPALPLPNPNAYGSGTPLYWQGYYGPSNGPQSQQQSLPQPPPALLIQPSMHLMQYPAINASAVPLPSSALTSGSSPVLMSRKAPTQVLPPTSGTTIMPSVSPLSTVWDRNAIPPVVPEKLKLDSGSTMLCGSVSGPAPSVAGTSGSFLNESSMPSLVTPDQLLPPGITKASSSRSSQTAQKDVEVVQEPSAELPVPTFTESQAPIMPRLPTSDHRAPAMPRPATSDHKAPLIPRPPTTDHKEPIMPRTPTTYPKGPMMPRPPTHHKLRGAPSYTYHNNRGGHGRGRGRGRESREVPSYTHHFHRGGCGRARENGTTRHVTGFTEDFDFNAMNEKFNKEEVWGDLGKSSKAQEDGHGSEDEDDGGPPELESKPVYVKDDFFDSLSCGSLGSRSGRTKFSEQIKVDTETFGEFLRYRGGARSGRGIDRAGHLRGSYQGRSYGYYRRGRGVNRGPRHDIAEPHLPDKA